MSMDTDINRGSVSFWGFIIASRTSLPLEAQSLKKKAVGIRGDAGYSLAFASLLIGLDFHKFTKAGICEYGRNRHQFAHAPTVTQSYLAWATGSASNVW